MSFWVITWMTPASSKQITSENSPARNSPRGAADKLRHKEVKMEKAIITVVGKDTVGIIASVCTYLAENKINILDISQTIVQGYFNMMMIVDITDLQKPFGDMAKELEQVGEEKVGVQIKCQREDIFDKMHRI